LQKVHCLKTGTPPHCDLDEARTLHDAVRSLIYGGSVKSAHDCSEGGLAVALAECCLSQQVARETPRLIGAGIDLSLVAALHKSEPGSSGQSAAPLEDVASAKARLDALLFGETQNRIVITTSALHAGKALAQAKVLGVRAGAVGNGRRNDIAGSRLPLAS
jgi:phosphoribosylformylglycinamidine synthase